MKIALYGDSYAVSENSLSDSWFSLLSERLGYPIDNYAKSGTSVYYSYRQFLSTYQPYDLIIFIVSDPNRYPGYIDFSENVKPNQLRGVNSLNTIDWIREHVPNLTSLDKKLLNDVEGWYKASDIEYINHVNALFIERIKLLHNNVIFYPAFYASFKNTTLETVDDKYVLLNLVLRQLSMLGFDMSNIDKVMRQAVINENHEVLSAHLAPEYNAAFANVMYNRIKTGVWNFSEFDNVQLMHDKTHYYLVG